MSVKQAKTMTHFQRNAQDVPVTIKPNATLPPRELFEGQTDVLEAYDVMVTLIEASRANYRDAKIKRGAAEAAALAYKVAVRDALSTGGDPSKLENTEPRLTAEAEAHVGFAELANAKAERQGHILGAAIKASAAECFEPCEQAMADSAESIVAAVAQLEAAWQNWGDAWAARKWLSNAHLLSATLADDVWVFRRQRR